MLHYGWLERHDAPPEVLRAMPVARDTEKLLIDSGYGQIDEIEPA